MLLSEYAITPDVFDATCYVSEELCAARLETIREALLNDSIVRDLRNGAWSQLFRDNGRPWHRRAKELARKLATQNRLISFAPQLVADPVTDSEWCDEALTTHGVEPLAGVIVTDAISGGYKGNPLVVSINRLGGAACWKGRSPSMRLDRSLPDYQNALSLILKHANSIMFIDPHIDPTLQRYRDFTTLLQAAGSRNPAPLVEIHRVCYRGSGQNRQILDLGEIEASFRGALDESLRLVGLSAEVFIWNDFHDRYLISDLAGISLPNGFDTTAAQNSRTTWTRLDRDDRDDVQREFDPASNSHTVRHRFRVGCD